MGEFAGWDMPLSYADGARAEHVAVRESVGIFDVSHMGEFDVHGAASRDFLQGVLANDLDEIGPGQGQYTLLCQEDGGVIDDLIVYCLADDRFRLVVNASNTEACRVHLAAQAVAGAELTDVSDGVAMLALQGSGWKDALAQIAEPQLGDLAWFGIAEAELCGHASLVARTGYTGEPGIELMCPWDGAVDIWEALAAPAGPAVPAGLVARDTLRLEMGYPLHGNELSTARSPIEAGLKWAVDLEGPGFIGSEAIRRQASEGTAQQLCAFCFDEPGIPRSGHTVLRNGEPIGTVTSGTMSPTRGIGIGMAYVDAEFAAPGTAITVDVRGKAKSATTARRPLVDTSPTKDDS